MITGSLGIPGTQSKRIPAFDLIKVFAMMYVIFGWHMDDSANNILATDVGRTLVIGALGAFVFVSGFTLTRSCGEINSFSDAWRFLQKRLLRIYPLYISSLLLFFITSEINSKQFVSGLFLLNAILNIQIKTLWFVTMIFLFYIMLPVIIYRFSVARILIVSLFFLTVTIVLHSLTGLMDLRLAYYFPIFIMGIFCAYSDDFFRLIKEAPIVVVSVIFLAAATYFFDPIKMPWAKHIYVPTCLIFSVSPVAVLAEKYVNKVNMKVIGKLSYVSFGMYLYHRFVFWILMQIYMPESDLKLVLYLFLAGFPILYLMSERIQTGYDFLLKRANLFPVDSRSNM